MKKFTRLLVSGILLISSLSAYTISAVADTDYAFSETYENFSAETAEDEGYEIIGEVTDGKLNVTITDTVNDKDITAYIAEYDSNGTLVKATLDKEARGGTKIENHVLDTKTSVVKVFLWEEGVNSMRPVTDEVLKIDVKSKETPTESPSVSPTDMPTTSPSASPTEAPTASPAATPEATATADPNETYTTDVIIKFTDEEGNTIKAEVTAESSKTFHAGDTYTVPEEYQKNILIKPAADGGMYTYYTFNAGTSELTAELKPEITILTLRFNGEQYNYYEDFEDYTLDLSKWHKQSASLPDPTIEEDTSKYIKHATESSTTGGYMTFKEIDTTAKTVNISADVKFTKPTAQSNGSIGNSQFAISNTTPAFSGNNITWGVINTCEGHIIVFEYNGGKTLTVNGKTLSTDFIGDWMHLEADVNFSTKSARITVTNSKGLSASFDDAKIYSSTFAGNIGSLYMRSAGANGTVSADNIAVNVTGEGGEIEPDIKSVLNHKSVYAFGDSIVYGHTDAAHSFMRLIANGYAMDLNMMAKNGATIMSSSNQILTQIKNAPATAPDFVVLEGYTNDAYGNPTNDPEFNAGGTQRDVTACYGEISPEGTTSFDTSTFCGSFENTIYTMNQKWGDGTKYVFVTIHKSGARNLEIQQKLRELTMQMCEKWDVAVVDMFTYKNANGNILDTTDFAQMSKYMIGGKGSHPNVTACEEFYIPAVVGVMEGLCGGDTDVTE